MKRRGFLGFLAGGAVAGPGMVKAAAQHTLADLRVEGGMVGIAEETAYVGKTGAGWSGPWVPLDSPVEKIASIQRDIARLMGLTEADRRRRRRDVHVSGLDPDLASMRSVSLSAKIEMQRARIVERDIQRELDDSRRHLGWLLKDSEDDA